MAISNLPTIGQLLLQLVSPPLAAQQMALEGGAAMAIPDAIPPAPETKSPSSTFVPEGLREVLDVEDVCSRRSPHDQLLSVMLTSLGPQCWDTQQPPYGGVALVKQDSNCNIANE